MNKLKASPVWLIIDCTNFFLGQMCPLDSHGKDLEFHAAFVLSTFFSLMRVWWWWVRGGIGSKNFLLRYITTGNSVQ